MPTISVNCSQVLMSMADDLIACASVNSVVEVLKSRGKTLTIKIVQRVMQAHFLDPLKVEISRRGHWEDGYISKIVSDTSEVAWTWGDFQSKSSKEDNKQDIAQKMTSALLMDQSLLDLTAQDKSYFDPPPVKESRPTTTTGSGSDAHLHDKLRLLQNRYDSLKRSIPNNQTAPNQSRDYQPLANKTAAEVLKDIIDACATNVVTLAGYNAASFVILISLRLNTLNHSLIGVDNQQLFRTRTRWHDRSLLVAYLQSPKLY